MTKGKQIKHLLTAIICIIIYFVVKSQRFKIDKNPYIVAFTVAIFIGYIWYEGIYKKNKIKNKKSDIKTQHLKELKARQGDFIKKIKEDHLPIELKNFIPVFNKWGIDNKILKEDLYKNATKTELYELKSIEDKREFIEHWIVNNPENTEITKSLKMTILSYDELGLWTWEKKN